MSLLESTRISMGESASEFFLKGSDGRQYGLSDFDDKEFLVIVFMCNHCPYVQAIWGRLVDLQEKYKDSSVQVVGINPNLNPDYPEESLEKMGEYYDRYRMNFPYLQDADQSVARAYNAQCTPDIYVYDKARKLVYHGRLDDNWRDPSGVQSFELDDAISSFLNGKELSFEQKPSMGCSIKWIE
jgi:peroxiredoxin